MKSRMIAVMLIAALASPAAVSAAKLKVGSAAPELSISKWMKGEAVDLSKAKPEDVYVVEFWATWCGPCVMSMPHMSKLQETFKDKHVTFIGISQEKTEVVDRFLKNGGDARMKYTVAIDEKGKTNKDYMEAAGQNGIPCAFIVKGGKVQWIGHPMDGLDLKVAELCGDKAFAERMKKVQKLNEKMQEAMDDEEWKVALKTLDELMQLDDHNPQFTMLKYHLLSKKLEDAEGAAAWGRKLVDEADDAQTLNEFAWTLLTEKEFAKPDPKLAKMAAKKAVDLSKSEDPAILDTYARALADDGDLTGAIEWQKKAVAAAKDNPQMAKELKKTLAEYEEKVKA